MKLLILISLGVITGLTSCSHSPNLNKKVLALPQPTSSAKPTFVLKKERYKNLEESEARIVISLSNQELYLKNKAGENVIVTDCSTALEGKVTPTGNFKVLEKIIDKRSNKYGMYVSKKTGKVVIPKSWEVRKAPPGTQYLGLPMPYWMRLTWYGVGMHIGQFERKKRSSFGCIRLPEGIQPLIYKKCKVGTPVKIVK